MTHQGTKNQTQVGPQPLWWVLLHSTHKDGSFSDKRHRAAAWHMSNQSNLCELFGRSDQNTFRCVLPSLTFFLQKTFPSTASGSFNKAAERTWQERKGDYEEGLHFRKLKRKISCEDLPTVAQGWWSRSRLGRGQLVVFPLGPLDGLPSSTTPGAPAEPTSPPPLQAFSLLTSPMSAPPFWCLISAQTSLRRD